MAIKTHIINSSTAQYTDEELQWLQSLFMTEGILGDAAGTLGLGVSQRGAGANMSVDVAAGTALVEVTISGRTFKVLAINDAVANVAVTSNSSGSDRVDAVIIRVDKDTEPNSLKTNVATIEVIAGTGTSALSDSAIDTSVSNDGWYRLADITVPNATADIEDGDITDTRSKIETNGAILVKEVTMENVFAKIGDFGDGSDGDIDLDGTNTFSFLSKSSSEYTMTRDIFANDLTIQSGSTLITNGYRIFVKGTISGAGTVKYPDGNNGANGDNQTINSAAGGAANTGGYLVNTAGSASGGGNNNFGAGAGGTAGLDGYTGTGAAGGNGGSGEGNGQSSGGAAGSKIQPTKVGTTRFNTIELLIVTQSETLTSSSEEYTGGTNENFQAHSHTITLTPTFDVFRPVGAGGGGGGGGGNWDGGGGTGGAGGGGGASGGVVAIFANTWAGTFTIQAIGGNGGDGGDGSNVDTGGGGGGAGGAGGASVVVYNTKTWTGSYNLAGGTGGTGGGGLFESGLSGANGVTGTSYEFQINTLL